MRKVRKLAKSELHAKNVFIRINQWTLGVIRYSAGIVDWTEGDLGILDRKARKILTGNGLFHPCANVVGLYLRRCKGRRGLISAKDYVLSKCNGPWDYLAKSEEPMLKEAVKEHFMVDKERRKEYARRNKERIKTNWKEKRLDGKFFKSAADFADSGQCFVAMAKVKIYKKEQKSNYYCCSGSSTVSELDKSKHKWG